MQHSSWWSDVQLQTGVYQILQECVLFTNVQVLHLTGESESRCDPAYRCLLLICLITRHIIARNLKTKGSVRIA